MTRARGHGSDEGSAHGSGTHFVAYLCPTTIDHCSDRRRPYPRRLFDQCASESVEVVHDRCRRRARVDKNDHHRRAGGRSVQPQGPVPGGQRRNSDLLRLHQQPGWGERTQDRTRRREHRRYAHCGRICHPDRDSARFRPGRGIFDRRLRRKALHLQGQHAGDLGSRRPFSV